MSVCEKKGESQRQRERQRERQERERERERTRARVGEEPRSATTITTTGCVSTAISLVLCVYTKHTRCGEEARRHGRRCNCNCPRVVPWVQAITQAGLVEHTQLARLDIGLQHPARVFVLGRGPPSPPPQWWWVGGFPSSCALILAPYFGINIEYFSHFLNKQKKTKNNNVPRVKGAPPLLTWLN